MENSLTSHLKLPDFIVGRLETCAFRLKDIKRRDTKTINEIILHCSDSDNPHTTIKWINKWHKLRSWAGCGYHYFINSKGECYLGRRENWIGCHCEGHNRRSIGICVNGRTRFNQKQAKTLMRLIVYLITKYREQDIYKVVINPKGNILKLISIVGHNRYNKKKTCPNFKVDTFLKQCIIKTYIPD